MKTYHILIGNCEELLSDFIEALFQEVCEGKAAVQCTRTARVGEFVRQACDTEFDLIIQVPHNLFPELTAPTPVTPVPSFCWRPEPIVSWSSPLRETNSAPPWPGY